MDSVQNNEYTHSLMDFNDNNVIYTLGITAELWINGRYNFTAVKYTFLDGTPFTNETMGLRDTGDPENNACVRRYRQGWRDTGCDRVYGFICEKHRFQ